MEPDEGAVTGKTRGKKRGWMLPMPITLSSGRSVCVRQTRHDKGNPGPPSTRGAAYGYQVGTYTVVNGAWNPFGIAQINSTTGRTCRVAGFLADCTRLLKEK